MKTIALIHDIALDVPAAAAWSVVADYAQDPQWRTGVLRMVPSPPGLVQLGTTTAEELRLAGQTWHNDGEVTAVVAGRSFRWRTTHGADAHGARTVEPLSERSCRVSLELNVVPHGTERLLAPMLRRMLQRNLRRDLRNLADFLAAEHSPQPVS